MPEEEFDTPLGTGSGAGMLFGTTGGVMEAALRTVYEIVTGMPMGRIVFEVRTSPHINAPWHVVGLLCRQLLVCYRVVPSSDEKHAPACVSLQEVRGLEGIKATTLNLKPAPGSDYAKYDPEGKGLNLSIAVANGLGNAKKLVAEMKAGTSKYDFIEVMACPSGCIGGGGQPRSTDKEILQKRQAAMYSIDERKTLRRSHENPAIQMLYKK